MLPVAMGIGTSIVLGREVLVRKRTVPGFFMPENAIEQPKTVYPTPQYYSGRAETVKAISSDDPDRKVLTTQQLIEISARQKDAGQKESGGKVHRFTKILPGSIIMGEEVIEEYIEGEEPRTRGRRAPKSPALLGRAHRPRGRRPHFTASAGRPPALLGSPIECGPAGTRYAHSTIYAEKNLALGAVTRQIRPHWMHALVSARRQCGLCTRKGAGPVGPTP